MHIYMVPCTHIMESLGKPRFPLSFYTKKWHLPKLSNNIRHIHDDDCMHLKHQEKHTEMGRTFLCKYTKTFKIITKSALERSSNLWETLQTNSYDYIIAPTNLSKFLMLFFKPTTLYNHIIPIRDIDSYYQITRNTTGRKITIFKAKFLKAVKEDSQDKGNYIIACFHNMSCCKSKTHMIKETE